MPSLGHDFHHLCDLFWRILWGRGDISEQGRVGVKPLPKGMWVVGLKKDGCRIEKGLWIVGHRWSKRLSRGLADSAHFNRKHVDDPEKTYDWRGFSVVADIR